MRRNFVTVACVGVLNEKSLDHLHVCCFDTFIIAPRMNSYIKPVKKACQNIAKAPFCLANSNHILHKFTRLFIKSVVGTKLGHLYYFPF